MSANPRRQGYLVQGTTLTFKITMALLLTPSVKHLNGPLIFQKKVYYNQLTINTIWKSQKQQNLQTPQE